MDNKKSSYEANRKARVAPYSKSIDLATSRKLEQSTLNQNVETLENDAEVDLRRKSTQNFYMVNRSMTSTLYHLAKSIPHTQDATLNTFSNKSSVINLSRINRFLILLKILSSVIYFIASPIALIILIQEFLGYFGVRFLRQCITLLYGMSLFITVILRVIVAILLSFGYEKLNTFYIVLLALTCCYIILDCVQVYFVFKLYNTLTSLNPTIKKSVLVISSRSCLPP